MGRLLRETGFDGFQNAASDDIDRATVGPKGNGEVDGGAVADLEEAAQPPRRRDPEFGRPDHISAQHVQQA
jgi:hypothetical protein